MGNIYNPLRIMCGLFILQQTLQFLRDTCKVLVVGAGGLGCELLKDLVSVHDLKFDVRVQQLAQLLL